MKKIPKKKRKVTELYFNEYGSPAEIYTYNTKLKKRLTVYAVTYPDLCQLIEDNENGDLWFEIDKHRISIRLTAPYIKDRHKTASILAMRTAPFNAYNQRGLLTILHRIHTFCKFIKLG